MNRKGFTLVELLATLAILGIIAGITIISISDIFGNAKNKTEEAFINTIENVMDMYIASDEVKESDFRSRCRHSLVKSHGAVTIYTRAISFQDIIESAYKPITQADLVNAANKNVECNAAKDIKVNIYRDEDYVYYYSIKKEDLGCLKSTGIISNLPKVNKNGNEEYYTCVVMR